MTWHRDSLQGYNGAALTVRNSVMILEERGGCGGTAPFFYPDQGNTSVDINGPIVQGGGASFRLHTRGVVRNLKVVDGSWYYDPLDVTCSLLSAWSASVVTLDGNGQPVERRALSC